jgi:hypothetical protein
MFGLPHSDIDHCVLLEPELLNSPIHLFDVFIVRWSD